MAWIESHDDVWEHHKTIKLCNLIEKKDFEVVGHLHSLWHFVLRNAWRSADLEPWGEEGIERAARWDGEKGKFIKSLRECGFLDGFIVHGWLERAGRLVYDRHRKENERLKADKRRKKGGLYKATVPYPTVPNRTVPNPDPPLAPQGGEAPTVPSLAAKDVMSLWNQFAAPELQEVRLLTDARERTVKARIASLKSIDDWAQLFKRVKASAFLKGENQNHWRASFDWVIKPGNIAKILEGNYDAR